MVEEALQAAANAMTKLARTLGTGSEKALFRIDLFWGDSTQDPIT